MLERVQRRQAHQLLARERSERQGHGLVQRTVSAKFGDGIGRCSVEGSGLFAASDLDAGHVERLVLQGVGDHVLGPDGVVDELTDVERGARCGGRNLPRGHARQHLTERGDGDLVALRVGVLRVGVLRGHHASRNSLIVSTWTPSCSSVTFASGVASAAWSESRSGASISTATVFALPAGSRNAVAFMPRASKNSERAGELNQCLTSSTSWIAMTCMVVSLRWLRIPGGPGHHIVGLTDGAAD